MPHTQTRTLLSRNTAYAKRVRSARASKYRGNEVGATTARAASSMREAVRLSSTMALAPSASSSRLQHQSSFTTARGVTVLLHIHGLAGTGSAATGTLLLKLCTCLADWLLSHVSVEWEIWRMKATCFTAFPRACKPGWAKPPALGDAGHEQASKAAHCS